MTKLCIVFILVSVFVHYKITGFHTKATQIPIFYFLIQAHDNHIRLRVNLNSANTAPTNDKANQLLEPSWLPDGYKAVNKQYTNNIYYITYIKNNHTTLEYEQTPNVTFTDADLSKSECNKYVHKGTSYYIYQKDKTIALLWFDQEYQYFLTGKESPQDMLKISYSTK